MNLSDAVILLVDDESQLLEIFSFWLRVAGCRSLHTAPNGEAALVVLKAVPVDLVVTDIHMPTMDGLTLVRHIGQLSAQIPSVVFVSGFADVDQREMYDLGVEAFLAKPLLREDFLRALEDVLADRSCLWLTPLMVAPRQSLLIQTQPTWEADGGNSFQLGRGGFCASYQGLPKLGKVSFRCCLPPDQQDISGEGHIRWLSKADQTIGVEFVYLDVTCRAWLLDRIATINPRSFIPSFCRRSDALNQLNRTASTSTARISSNGSVPAGN